MPGLRGHISRFCWLVPLTLLLAGCSSPLRKFQAAEQMQKDGRYAAAIRTYAEVLTRLPDEQSQLASLVTLHIAECQWAMAEPKAALLTLENSLAADPENLRARLRLAEFMLVTGSPQIAIENAQWVLAREPQNLDAVTVLGGAHAVLGQVAEAQAFFQRVLSSDPARVEAALTLAQIYAAMGDAAKARNVLLQAAHASGSGPVPWLALGRLEEEAGNINAAEENYRQAVAVSKDRQAKLRLAEFLTRSSRITEAEQVLAGVDGDLPRSSTVRADFELLLGRAPEAAAKYASFLTDSTFRRRELSQVQNPDQSALTRAAVIVRLIEAELATAYKQTEKVAAVTRAKTLFDQYKAELDESASESLQAEMALVVGDLSQAELHSKRAIEMAPHSAAANFIAGLVKRAARDLPTANVYWNTALEKDPDFLPARQALAEQALSRGDTNAAEEHIAAVVRREPANFEALCIYARALTAQGKNVAAGLIARRALAADSTSAEPHLILGNLAMQKKRWASAFIEYQQAILLNPDSAGAMAALGRVYRKGKITRPMVEQMERIAGNPPASATLMEIVGGLYADRGWHDDAERALRKAAGIDPRRATAATALALAYLRHGKERAAADSLAMTGGGAAQLIAGMRSAEGKDVVSAIRNYESAIRSGEHTGAAANNLAWIYAQQGTALDRALELAQFARGLAPQDPAVLDTVGFVQLRRRQYSQAIETLKQALSLADSPAGKRISPDALQQLKQHLAEAYLRSGQPEAAATLEKSLP